MLYTVIQTKKLYQEVQSKAEVHVNKNIAFIHVFDTLLTDGH